MRVRKCIRFALATALLCGGCGSTGQERVSYPAYVVGADASSFSVGDWAVELTMGQIAFGPLYLCAATTASTELCQTAIQELRSTHDLDVLETGMQALGDVHGSDAEVRSALYDFGITWLPTQESPTVVDSSLARGHSAHFEGVATRGGLSVPFAIDVDIAPQFRGSHAVEGQRFTPGRYADHHVLLLHVDASAWWQQVDFDALGAALRTGQPPPQQTLTQLTQAMTALAPLRFEWVIQ
jgi:hypothetical protein